VRKDLEDEIAVVASIAHPSKGDECESVRRVIGQIEPAVERQFFSFGIHQPPLCRCAQPF
jgi:hypothetical protein